jgi:hypothetical protein
LAEAQRRALSQTPNPIDASLESAAQSLLANPNGGLDYNTWEQNQLEQLDNTNAQAMEAARGKLGNTSQSGELQNAYLQNLLTESQGRANTSATLDVTAADEQTKNLIAAIASGKDVSSQITANQAQAIANMVSVTGAGNNAENIAAAQNLQSMSEAWQGNQTLTQDQFNQGMQIMSESWQTGEQLSQDDYNTYITNIQAQLAIAKANNDAANTTALTKLQADLTLERDAQQQGYAVALQNNAANIASALSSQNYDQAMSLQQSQQDFSALEHDKDLEMQAAAQKIQEEGVDMSAINAAFAAGTIDGDTYRSMVQAAMDGLNKTLPADQQITVTAPDADAVTQQQTQQYNDLEQQYGLSHPDLKGTDLDKAFATYYNQLMYKEGATGTGSVIKTATDDNISAPDIFGGTIQDGSTQAGMTFADNGSGMELTQGGNQALAAGTKFALLSDASVMNAPSASIPAGVYTSLGSLSGIDGIGGSALYVQGADGTIYCASNPKVRALAINVNGTIYISSDGYTYKVATATT